MMRLAQFDYIFAIAMIFAFLDAWNIGANDVANSFASSISSRSLKYWQAMILAALCEFLGAVLVGNRVSDTIRNKIFDVSVFAQEPAVLMCTMMSALVGSSLWLTLATSIGMPVSTTHSIVGGTIGAAIGAKGGSVIHWGWGGVAQIVASWFIAPAIAGGFASIIFLISKFSVLEVKNLQRSLKNALLLVPCLVFLTFSVLTMLIVWKGSPKLKLNKLSTGTTVGAILGTGGVAFVVFMIFFYPYFRRKLIHNDWTLPWYGFIFGPIYYFKSTDSIPPMPEGHELVIDYYEGRRYDNDSTHSAKSVSSEDDVEKSGDIVTTSPVAVVSAVEEPKKETTKQKWWRMLKEGPKSWPRLVWLVLIHGFDQDIIRDQVQKKDVLSGDLKRLHGKSKYYDNKIEYLFSLLQAITACTMSFAHGANDISNATGPLATVYLVWTTNTTAKKADVPIWILAYAAAALVIGVWTFGYNIMRTLGNKLILQSPSRGFSIELGAALTTVIATQLAIPVSTTQSAVGATVFVGLCNKDIRSVNWRVVTWCYLGWIVTLPCAGLVAGLLNGILVHAPTKGMTYVLSN